MKFFRLISILFLFLIPINIFSQLEIQSISSVKIEYDRESLSGRLIVHYIYPENLHQIYPSTFHAIEVRGDRGFKWEDPIYSERDVISDDDTEYYETESTITIPFTLRSERILLLIVNAGYQLCDEKLLCFMPQTESHLINFPDEAIIIY